MVAILNYYFEVGDVGCGMIVGHNVLVNSTGNMTTVFLDSILYTSAGFTYVGKVTIFFRAGPFVNNVLFQV